MTTSASFLTGVLTITSDDTVTLAADTNNYVILTINGSSTPIEPTRSGGVHTNANEVTEISIVDTGIGKTIDLRSVTKTKFDSLTSTSITGGAGNDTIWGSYANDVIIAGNGDDSVDGGEGSDTLYGGAGNDILDGGEGTSSTSPGNDVIFGEDGNDTIGSSIGNDIYLGGSGNDVISADGSEGHILVGGAGVDTLTGGPGSDILIDGTTLHDSDMVALKAIRSAWISDSTYTSRINDLLGNNSTSANAPYYLTSTTTVDDSDADSMLGGTGMDWFLRTKSNNTIGDLESGEWIGENSSTPAAHNDVLKVNSSVTSVTIPLSTLFINDGSPNGVIQLQGAPTSPTYGTLTQSGTNLIFSWGSTSSSITDATFSYSINNGNGDISPTPATVTIHRGAQSASRFIGDVDGDDENEVVDFQPNNDIIKFIDHSYVSAGSQTAVNWGNISSSALWLDPMMGDFNGDGRQDIVARDGMTGQWNVWISGASSNPTTGLVDGKPWGTWDTGWNWTPALVGDFNGDGRDDIFGFDLTHGDFYVEASTGTGFTLESWGNIQTYLQYLSGSSSLTPKFQVVDFDGDGRQDVLVYDSTGFQWAFVLSKGLHFSTISTPYMSFASSTTFIAAGNFDGSGGEQVLLQTRATSTDPYTFKLLKYNPNNTSSVLEISTASWGTNSYSTINFQAVDVNQDGRMDLLGQNTSNGHWIVGRNTGSTISIEDWGDYYSNATSDLSWTYTSNSITTTVVDPTVMFDRFLEAFSWVYNNVELELYPGFLKGTEATRQTKAGNDWDQANLLIQDLRSRGISADFAYGRITAQVNQVRQWLSLSPSSSDQVVFDTLTNIADNPSSISGGMITFNHAWVKVTLPDATGYSGTFYVDPSWKFKDLQSFISTYSYTSNVRTDYLNYWVTRDIASNPLPLPLEFFEQKVQDYLASHNGTDTRKSLADVTYDGPIRQRLFTAVTAPGYTLPSTIYVESSAPQAVTTKAVLTLSNLDKTVDYWTQTIDVPSVSLSTVSVEWISPDEFGLWRNNGGTIEWYFDRNGSRAWESSDALSPIPSYGGASTDKVAIGDFNGDGIDQIAVYKPSTGDFYLDGGDFAWEGTAPSGDYLAPFGVTGGTAVVGDWDGDGKDDIGVYISSSNTWYLDLDGNGVFDANKDLTITYGATNATPLVGDWNGDGKDELGYWTTSGGTEYFHLDVNGDRANGGDWVISRSYTAGDVPVAGDWDGDGRTDIAIFNSGSWDLFKIGLDGQVAATQHYTSFGLAGDVPFAINIEPRRHGVLKIDGIAQSASLSSSNPLLTDATQVDLQVKRYDWDLSSGVQSTLRSRDYVRPSGQTLVLAIQALQQSSSLLEQARDNLNYVLADAIQPSTDGQGLPDFAPRVVREIAQLAGVQYFHVKMESDREIAGLTNSLILQNFVGLGIITVSEDFDYNSSNSIPYIPTIVFVDIKDMSGFPINRNTGLPDVDVMHLVLDNSSALESYTIESLMNTDSISTIKGIALANYVNHIGPADPVYNLQGNTQTNIDTINYSDHSDDVKQALRDALAQGAKLMFAKQKTSIGTWTGSVYLTELVNSNTYSFQYAINKDGQTYDGGYRAGTPQDDSFNLPQSSFQSFAGDPVKIDTGSYYREDADVSLPNLGKALEMVRYYGSQESDADATHAFRDLGFGYGWRDSYSDFLRLTKGTNWATDYTSVGDIEWYTPKGTKFTFTRNSNGTYSIPASLGGTLASATVSTDGVNGFRYVDVDGTTYLFETVFHDGNYYDSAGTARLIKITDRYGNGIKVTYATTSYSSNHFTGTIFANGEDTPEFLKIASVEDNEDSNRKLTFGYYSSTNHIHTITDWNSRVWTYEYESLYDPRINGYRSILTSVTTPADSQTLARTTHYAYYKENTAAIGLMKSYTDAAGATTLMEYYANRKLMRTIDPLGGVNFYTYDIFHQNTSFINEHGEKEKYRYDSKGREIAKLSTDGSLETYAWNDTTDRMTSKTDAFGYTTSYTYTTNGLLDTLTTPNNIITDYTYGTFGNAIQIDRKVGSTSSQPNQTILNNYDSLGRLIWSKDAVGNYTLYGYGATAYDGTPSYADRGLPNAVTTARGVSLDGGTPIVSDPDFRTYYLYNPAGQVVGSKQGIVQFTDTYSNKGYLLSHQAATGESTSYTRDLLGDALTTTQVAAIGSGLTAIATSSTYDLDGRMLSSTDALGRVTRYLYDTKGRLTNTILPDFTQIQKEYDAVGNLIKSIDQIGRETRYVYDSRNRLISTGFADGAVERIRYDADGQVITRWDGNGNETDFSYDKMGRLVRETKPDPDSDLANSSGVGLTSGQTVSTHYLYDDTVGGKLKEARQENGASTNNVRMSTLSFYDAADRLIQTEEINRIAGTIVSVTTYGYDANNNLIDTKFYDVTSQNWTATTVVTPSALASMVSSNSSTLRETQTWYDVFDRAFRFYDALNHFTAKTYDDAGRVLTVTDKLSNVTTNHYDGFGRLDSVTAPPAHSGDSAPVTHYGYDPTIGRMISQTDPMGNVTEFTYDTLDRKIAVTKAAGVIDAVTQYVFDAAGQLISTVDPMGRADHSVYDLRGRVTRYDESDPDGIGGTKPNVTQYAYDGAGNLIKQTDAWGSVTIYGYDHWNRVQYTLAPDPDKLPNGTNGSLVPTITISGYDAWGNSTSTWEGFYSIGTDGTPSITTGSGLVRKVDTSTFDYKNRVATQASADSDAYYSQISPTPSSNGSEIPQTTTYTFNGFGDLAKTQTQVSASAYLFHYYKYDALGRQIEDGTSNGNSATDATYTTKTSTFYDDNGNVTTVKTRLSYNSGTGTETTVDTNYTYDNLGRLETSTNPDPDGASSLVAGKTTYAYDLDGNLLSKSVRIGTTDANKVAVTNYGYDALNRLISTTEPGPTNNRPITTKTYDRAGELTSTTDAEGNRTRYVYDNVGRVIQEISPERYTRSYTYNEFGELVQEINRDGKITAWEYDALGRVTKEKWFNSDQNPSSATPIHTIMNEYDSFGRLVAIKEGDNTSNPSTVTISYTYDNRDRVLKAIGTNVGAQGYSIEYSYDADQARQIDAYVTSVNPVTSNVDKIAHIETDYTFDGNRRIQYTTVKGIADTSNSQSSVVNTPYDMDGQFNISLLSNNGSSVGSIQYAYDNARRLTQLLYRGVGGAKINEYDVTYNADDWITSLSTSQETTYHDSPATYTYDDRGELTDAVYSNSSYVADLGYDYDLTGNRTDTLTYDDTRSSIISTSNYDTATGNRLTSDGTYGYEYDKEGHLITKTTMISDGSGGQVNIKVATYSWDHRGRMTDVNLYNQNTTNAIQKIIHYTYDALDQRIRRQIDNDPSTAGTYDIDERYIYDGDKLTFVVDGNSSTFDTLARYAYLPNAPATLARIGGNAYWLLTDEQGSVKDIEGIAMSSGTPAQHIRYDAFGNVVSIVGSAGGTPIAHLGYTGQELDNVTGLLNYGARWYDPKTGRFISQDPSGFDGGKDMNLYRYVGNNASTLVDPTGLVGGSPSFGASYSPLSLSSFGGGGYSSYSGSSYSGSSYASSSSSWNFGNNLLGGMDSLPTFGFDTSTPSRSVTTSAPMPSPITTTAPAPRTWGGFFSDTYNSTANSISNFATDLSYVTSLSSSTIGTSVYEGVKTGGKAVINGAASSVVSTATLGMYNYSGPLSVSSADRFYGYDTSFGLTKGSVDVLTAVGTGYASGFGRTGELVNAFDAAGNLLQAGIGAQDVYSNGLNFQNGTQILGGSIGFGGNAWGLSRIQPSQSISKPLDVAEQYTTGYRIVQDVELEDLLVRGQFYSPPGSSTPTGKPGKFFYTNAEDAMDTAAYWSSRDGKAYTLVRAEIPDSSIAYKKSGVDRTDTMPLGKKVLFSEYDRGLQNAKIEW